MYLTGTPRVLSARKTASWMTTPRRAPTWTRPEGVFESLMICGFSGSIAAATSANQSMVASRSWQKVEGQAAFRAGERASAPWALGRAGEGRLVQRPARRDQPLAMIYGRSLGG